MNNVCIFRGEEKVPSVAISVPTEEILSKLVWGYGSVPYLFGYAASGYEIDLLALHRYREGDKEVLVKTVIGNFSVDRKEHLFEVILALLNLSLLFQSIVDACPASGKYEFMDITRSSGVVVHLFPTFVRKVFPDTSRFDHLRVVYDRMKDADVPNVDRLTEIQLQTRCLEFKPRGMEVKPSTLFELFDALRDVLEALVGLHNLGLIHRDIRWPNVIRQRDSASWFLIDFTNAATSPQPSLSGQHLSREEHAPEIFVENGEHTTAVDIWAVGFLIEKCMLEREKWQDVRERRSFYLQLMAEDPTARPSAEKALEDLLVLKESARREQESNRALQQEEKSETQGRKRKRSA